MKLDGYDLTLPTVVLQTKKANGGTIGELFIDGEFFCYTLERDWVDNKPSVSAVPLGVYRVDFTMSPRFKRKLYLLDAVPGRSGIRIHPANQQKELEGCIALGKKISIVGGEVFLQTSAVTVNEFHVRMKEKSFNLNITSNDPDENFRILSEK